MFPPGLSDGNVMIMVKSMGGTSVSIWLREKKICRKCRRWRRAAVIRRHKYVARDHDPCIQDLPGSVWGCCGHGAVGEWPLGYVAGHRVRTFRFFGNVPGNAIRRALRRIRRGLGAPMWVLFDLEEKRSPTSYERKKRRLRRLMVR